MNFLENQQTHDSYGMLQFSRTYGDSKALFGSSIQHHNTIRMTLKTASTVREGTNDYYFGKDVIVECEMSQSQFAELITSMNMGDGIPVTIKFLKGKGMIEPCPFTNKKKELESEFRQNLQSTSEQANEILKTVKQLFDEKKSFTKKDKEDIIHMIEKLQRDIGDNREYIYRQFNRQMEKSTLEAKGEIEAFMETKIHSIAANALAQQNIQLSELPNPIALDDTNE